jgi:eukaryotic-like serine/threonine-protein kinase
MPTRSAPVSLPARYRVIHHIATGGMASVWAVEDERLGRMVAIKVLTEGYAADPAANRRFQREARAAARVSGHPHVVTIYDVGEHGGRPFIVMEHFAGTVAQRLKDGSPIPRALALRWLREAAAALDTAHAAGVVHRDVKPGNLLLDERARLAVGDFGIATVAAEASLTMTGQVLGTAGYLSPEQAAGGKATPASDRYSLGVVAFELLTGSRPFTASDVRAQLRAHVEDDPPVPGDLAGDLPPRVDAVIARALAKAPDARPATAAALVDELDAALDPTTATANTRRFVRPAPAPAPHAAATPRSAESAPPSRAPRRSSRRLVVLAFAALAAVAGALVAIATSPEGHRAARRTTAATHPKPTTTHATTTSSAPATTQPQAADPVALNDQGFALLQSGQAAAAVDPLRRSVEAFRSQGRTGEITYAYALYNLAEALRRSGHPDQAIPLYQERLRVSRDQRGVVLDGLRAAEAALGEPVAKHGKGHGKKKAGD